jgi:hypothetical protein
MIATLVWKEYREQRLVWLVLAVLSAVTLAAAAALLDPGGPAGQSRQAELLLALAAFLTWAHGMVCGAIMLAGEVEEGTMPSLDLLPCTRSQLWRMKTLTGTILVLGNALSLTAVLTSLAAVPQVIGGIVTLGLLVAFGMIGFAWAILASSSSTTVLVAIGKAIGWQALVAFVGFLVLLVVECRADPIGSIAPWELSLPAFVLLVLVGAVALMSSMLVFAGPDRLRIAASPPQGTLGSWLAQWLGLLRMTWRQSRLFCILLWATAFVGGWGILVSGPWGWPWATLLIGLLCGLTCFPARWEETAAGVLKEPRFPAGRVWFVLLGLRAAAGASALVVLLCPAMCALVIDPLLHLAPHHSPRPFLGRLFGDDLIGAVATPWPFFCMWFLHGFALGQLGGIVCGKPILGFLLASLGSLLLVGLWVPSLLTGGLHLTQTLGVPLAALVAGRLLFAARRTHTPLSRLNTMYLAATGCLGVLWTVGGIADRVIEVPEPPPLEVDIPRYLASLPAVENNLARPRIRAALSHFVRRIQELPSSPPARTFAVDEPLRPEDAPFGFQLHSAISREGWPANRAALESWMEQLFDAPWPGELAEAVQLPVGVLADLRKAPGRRSLVGVELEGRAAMVLAGHGLLRQAQGDAEAFVADLRTGLAYSRHLRKHASQPVWSIGLFVQHWFLSALDQWLMALDDRPELLREVLRELRRHESETAGDGNDTRTADYLLARDDIDHPEQVLRLLGGVSSRDEGRLATVAAMSKAWAFPRERERNLRLLGWLHAGTACPPEVVRQTPWKDLVHTWDPKFEARRRHELAQLRMREVAVALRCYRVVKGTAAEHLDVLVPDFLPAIPPDPYDEKPIRFRISSGEVIKGWARNDQTALPGQGILWCVGADGADGQDCGGRRNGSWSSSDTSEDAVYLVPLPPRREAEPSRGNHS